MEKEGKSASPIEKAGINNRLWVVSELYYPENNQTGYYMTRIAEGLTDDFNVAVICGQPNYAARGTRAPKKEFLGGVEIFRVWGTTLDKNVTLYKLVNMFTLSASIFFKSLLKFGKGDDVLIVSAPPSLPFIASLAAMIRGAEYTLVIHDKYPEILVAVGQAKPGSLFVKILNWLNIRLYNNARKIIVVGRDMGDLVAEQIKDGANGTPIAVIPNWASLEEVEPMPRRENPLLKDLGILEKFVFLYAGNMGHPQDIESIVYCADKLKNDERFHFLFIGSGVKRKWLEKEVAEKQLANVTIVPPKPREEQKIFLNAADVGLVSLVRGMYGVAMPSRTYNLMAAGKPVLALAENDLEVSRVIEEDKVGWHLPASEPEKLLAMIRRIYDERSELPAMAERARASAVEKYSLETAINKYKDAMKA